MFIKFNKATVTRLNQRGQKQHRKRSPDADAFCEEMGDDDMGDEPPPSIAGVFSRPNQPSGPSPSERKADSEAEEHAQSVWSQRRRAMQCPAWRRLSKCLVPLQQPTFRPLLSTNRRARSHHQIPLDRLPPTPA